MVGSRQMGKSNDPQWGSLAVARSGDFVVEIDEVLDGPESYHVMLQSPRVYVSYQLADLEPVSRLLTFFNDTRMTARARSFSMGKRRGRVAIEKDDELPGRYFLVWNGVGRQLRLTLSAEDVGHCVAAIADALGQAAPPETAMSRPKTGTSG